MARSSFAAVTLLLLAISGAPGIAAPAHADVGQSVRTQAGTRCYVFANDIGHGGGPSVACQRAGTYPFPQAPMSEQFHEQMNIAIGRDNGGVSWDIGNIPGSAEAAAKDIILDYDQTYYVNGWSIASTPDGTRFTNDRTGHGIFVSVENVYGF